jgi:hypothetical protein
LRGIERDIHRRIGHCVPEGDIEGGDLGGESSQEEREVAIIDGAAADGQVAECGKHDAELA